MPAGRRTESGYHHGSDHRNQEEGDEIMGWVAALAIGASLVAKTIGGIKKAKGESAESVSAANQRMREGQAEAEIQAGIAAAKEFEADQLEYQAGQEIASSQRAALEERRKARILESRAIAVAAASGGAVDDPTIQDILADIQEQGEYRALTVLFEGKTRSFGLELQAEAREFEAKQARRAGEIARETGFIASRDLVKAGKRRAIGGTLTTAGELIGSGVSLYGKYGGGKSSGGST